LAAAQHYFFLVTLHPKWWNLHLLGKKIFDFFFFKGQHMFFGSLKLLKRKKTADKYNLKLKIKE